MNGGDVEASAVAKNDMYRRRLHIGGSMEAVHDGVGTSAGYHPDRKTRSR